MADTLLAALRMLFDYLVVGQVLAHNPAAAVRGPRLVIRSGKTPVLEDSEARTLLASIAGEDLADRRDKALLAVLLYSFARVSAVVRLRVRDYECERRRSYLALREKGGQHRRVPVHSRAAEALDAYRAAHTSASWIVRDLRDLGHARAKILDLVGKDAAAAQSLPAEELRAAYYARTLHHLPRPRDVRLDLARSANALGPRLVSALTTRAGLTVIRHAVQLVQSLARDDRGRGLER